MAVRLKKPKTVIKIVQKKDDHSTRNLIIGGCFLLALVGLVFFFTKETVAPSGADFHRIARGDIELEFDSSDSAEQDDPDDVEWHIFEITSDDLDILKDENHLDCDNAFANPVVIDFSKPTVTVAEEGMQWIEGMPTGDNPFCRVNLYRGYQTADWQDDLEGDGIELIAKDLGDVDSDAGATEEATMSKAGGKYLVMVRAVIGTEVGDVIPFAFVVQLAEKVDKDLIGQSAFDDFNIGTTNVRLEYNYLSDALESGEYQLGGVAMDDEDHEKDLDASLNGWMHSDLTTSTSIDLTAVIELKVSEDGYAIVLDNPLASGNTERAYLTVTPYGENGTADGVWLEYGTSGITGDVPFSTANVNTKQILFQAEMQEECDNTIVSSSGEDSVVDGNEKLYECTEGQVAKGKNAVVEWHIFFDEILVDYDDSATANDEEVNGASGSSGEDLADIDLIGLASATDRIAQTLSP